MDIQLSTAALGYAANVGEEASIAAGAWLEQMALAFAASKGSLDATERAELLALRRFRDGIASLRTELASWRDQNDPTDAYLSVNLAIETIDAFFTLSTPSVEPSKAVPG